MIMLMKKRETQTTKRKDRGRRKKTWEKIFYEIFREDLVSI